jgi:hypothetical protein
VSVASIKVELSATPSIILLAISMKCVLVFAVMCAVLAVALTKETYTTKWDGIDLDQILSSDRLLTNYMNCLMERGRCTPDGSDLKSKALTSY